MIDQPKLEQIVWNDEKFNVGNAILDAQHKKIMGLINALLAEKNLDVHSEVLQNSLAEMLEYAQDHLSYEEALLEKIGFEDLVEHRNHHWEYLEMVSELTTEVSCEKEGSQQELITYLTFWWQHHILHEDMEYKDAMQKHMADSLSSDI